MGGLISADEVTATVPRQFTIGRAGNACRVNTLLSWTLAGLIPLSYRPKSVGQSRNAKMALFNFFKRRQHDPDEGLLHFSLTFEGVNFNYCSSRVQSLDDIEAMFFLIETI